MAKEQSLSKKIGSNIGYAFGKAADFVYDAKNSIQEAFVEQEEVESKNESHKTLINLDSIARKVGEPVNEWLDSVGDSVGDAAAASYSAFGNSVRFSVEKTKEAADYAASFYPAVKKIIDDSIDYVSPKVSDVASYVSNVTTNAKESVANFTTNAYEYVTDVSNVTEEIGQPVKGFFDSVGDSFGNFTAGFYFEFKKAAHDCDENTKCIITFGNESYFYENVGAAGQNAEMHDEI